MLELHSVQSHPEPRFASKDSRHAVSVLHTPSQNHLLAALPLKDYALLLPYLMPISLPLGWTVYHAGDQQNHLYFLTEGIVSRFYVMESGESAESALTGNEGVIGVASFLGGRSTPSHAVVLSTAYAYQLAVDMLENEFWHDGSLQRLLLRYTQALMTQTAQTAVCNRHHTVDQQLCRWILSSVDRLPTNELTITHERIAYMLGVRRESVTAAAVHLQESGMIHYSRGHITVLDRPQLEAHACECYSVVKREYDRLLPGQGKSENS